MTTQHASPEAFHKLLRGDSTREEARQIVSHLLAGCGRCIKRSATAQTADGEPGAWKYDELFERVERWLDLELTHDTEPLPAPMGAAAPA
jgi:hypothetical protein